MRPSIYSPEEDSYLMSETISNYLSKIKSISDLTVLEIGCGSGIQLETLEKSGVKKENIFSSDTNPEAVKHCKNLGFNSIQSDLFEKIPGKFDLIIFNPPYLPEDEKEPKDSQLATTGGKNGSEIINEFLNQSKKHLNQGGKILLLTSSLTKGINWHGFKRKLLKTKNLFFEELCVWEIWIS